MNDIMNAKVFGADHRTCRFTGRPLEQGSGALDPEVQAVGILGQMQYEAVALKNKRREAADKLAAETATLSNMHDAHNKLRADDLVARQGGVYRLAAQDTVVTSCKAQCAALAAEHEALTAKIAEVGAKLTDEGVFARHGTGAANAWIGKIRDNGWSLPS